MEGNITGWFDGACEPINPGGHASYGALVKYDDVIVFSEGCYVGHGKDMSNNVAEYSGCIAVLEQIKTMRDEGCSPINSITIFGDSKLVINQLQKKWKIHGGLYVPFYQRAAALLKEISGVKDLFTEGAKLPKINFQWIPREENSECDALSKGELHKREVKFKIQPV